MTNKTNLYNAPEGVEIIPGILIQVNHYWGRGATIEEAWKSVQKEKYGTLASLKKERHLIYSVLHYKTNKKDTTVFTYVDDMGYLTYHMDYPPHLIHKKK